MFLTNHTLTGVVLSRVIDDPVLLAPTAFASHIALDALPHFGYQKWGFMSRNWYVLAVADNLVALSIFIITLVMDPDRWALTATGVFFACLPDLLFLIEIARKGRPFLPAWRRFHSHIQWGESPLGIFPEALWAFSMIALLRGTIK